MRGLIYNIAAIVALFPAALVTWRSGPGRDTVFWAVLVVAAAGSVSWSYALAAGEWHTGLSVTLWVSISASLVVFILLSLVARHAWRLTPLLLPYLIVLALIATIWSHAPERPIAATAPETWLGVHIAVSVLTYALLTIAAVAGLAVVLQERALRRKRIGALARTLPSIADGERLAFGLLVAGEIVLGAGLVTGIATGYLGAGEALALDHKTLLSGLAFVVIGLLLLAHWRTGVRGRRAARYVLLAYLLLTLAYPGVKFVTDVLVG